MSTNERNMQHLSFRAWITSLKIIVSSSAYTCGFHNFTFLMSWIIFHYVNITHFHYLFISWWIFILFPFPDHCEWRSNEHRWASLSVAGYRILWVYQEALLNPVVDLFLASWWISTLIPIVAPPESPPYSSKKVFLFPHIHTRFCHHQFFTS